MGIWLDIDSRTPALRLCLLSKLLPYFYLHCILHGLPCIFTWWFSSGGQRCGGRKDAPLFPLGSSLDIFLGASHLPPHSCLDSSKGAWEGVGDPGWITGGNVRCVFGASSWQSGRNIYWVRCCQVGRPAWPLREM